MSVSEIRTRRLRIRRAEPRDLADIHAILGDPAAMRYWSTPAHGAMDQSRCWLDAMIAAPTLISDDYVIENRGRVIGKAGCWRLPEIGYILRRDSWGNGFGYEALEAIIARIMATRALSGIVADVDPRNIPSLALLDRLGFRETGRAARTMEVGGEWCDSVYLALSREDFARRRGPGRQ